MKNNHLWHLFLNTATQYPNALALISGSHQLTYQELQNEVFHYATYLHQAGVRAGDKIGVLLSRDHHLIISLLGIMASGACYVPIEFRFPMSRQQHILKDSECKYLIKNSQDEYSEISLLIPPSQIKSITPYKLSNTNFDTQQLAYIIYTSGSTGQPKGVMITHANASSMIDWATTNYTKSDLSYTLASTSICFDLSIFEIFVPLAIGGCIVLVNHALSLLNNKINTPITLINTVPSAIQELIIEKAIPSSVKVINLAGEALQQSIVNDLYKKTSVERVYNLYGPTETTTYSTYYLAKENYERIMVPIGNAIAGTKIILLDQHQQPVPKLGRGEIYIGGEGVSRGYCNRLTETNERFIEIIIKGSKIKLYRTGDLARINHDQELEYLGRLDHQVKIRGFRVEPNEVAYSLMQHEAIKQAFVTIYSDVNAEQQLIAYIVLHESFNLQEDTLKAWLVKQIPDYMLPSYYFILDALPINNNGKISRESLPLPNQPISNSYEFETDTEEKLAKIWQSLIPHQSFGRHDNFFYVGGHSLLAARLQAKIAQHFEIEFKLEEIFEKPSISEQAKLIEQRQEKKLYTNMSFNFSERPKEIPLSYSQQRLWYLQYAEESTPISNIPIVINIKGALDLSALENSFQSIIKRHEILRTTYKSINYHIVQIINNDFTFTIPTVLCDENYLSQLLSNEANKKFDLTSDLMIRVTLFKTNHQNKLMIVQHHIASDAWSLNILMHELSLYYDAYHLRKTLPALPEPVQYADYSCWQRINSNKSQHIDLAFWKSKLENAPDTIKLPYDFPRTEITSYHGEFYSFSLNAELVNQLKLIANKNQCTLFMVLLTAFNILLYRYTQQKDFCIGILSANRPFNDLERTLGFFVNTLVTRNQVESTISTRQLLKQTRRTVLDCLSHQQLPFDKLVEALRPNRQSNRHPFFQVLFSLQNALHNDLKLNELELEASEFDRKIAKFDLTLSLVEIKNCLTAIFEFNTDLFYRDTIARMASNYLQILEHMVDNLDTSVGEINLLSIHERKRWLIDFNSTETTHSKNASLIDFFVEIVNAFPNKIAVIDNDQDYTYTELNRKSNQLAHYLIQHGVSPDMPVAILLPRNIDVIVAMLGILKAGGCYVPMDPTWPMERFDYILSDGKINTIISQSKCINNLPSNVNVLTILLDKKMEQIRKQPSHVPQMKIYPTNNCYIMFTSGSTGKPKGVIAKQQGVIRLVKNQNYVELSENHTLLQVSQLVFDGSTFDIWGSLLNGSTLVLMPDGLPELNKLAELLTRYQVTTLFITTQLFNTLVDYKLTALSTLKQLLFGGDVASIYHVEQFKKVYPTCLLRNMYGPTECTTFALSYLIPDKFDKNKSLPLGVPISDTIVVILSEDLQVVPIGVRGEIYLGGPGLAKEYLNQPELTQDKFINNPIKELKTDRLYRTGDMGSYRSDGQITFLGRIDDQIKLRGYRIELAEIEQALTKLETVIDAVVLLQKPEDLLIAYILITPGLTLPVQIIRQELSKHLPHYMLPDAIQILSEYPLTSNWKIDKEKLPKFQLARQPSYISHADNKIAVAIHQIWVDILDDHEVTYEDNFFEIGGNSLKIVHILDKLQSHFQDNPTILAKLDITVLFQYPTILALSEYLQDINKDHHIIHDKQRINRRDKRKEANQ